MKNAAKKIWSYLMIMTMVLSLMPVTTVKAVELSTLRFSKNDTEKATISYKIGDADFKEVDVSTADPGGNIRVRDIDNQADVVVKVIPNEGVKVRDICVLEGEGDDAASAFNGASSSISDGLQYTFVARAGIAYSLVVEYENEGGNQPGPGPMQQQGEFRFVCQSYTVTGGDIYYKLNDQTEFTKVSVSDNNYEPIDVSSANTITLKLVPAEGYKVDQTRGAMLNGQRDVDVNQLSSENGCVISLANYIEEGKTVAESSFELEFGFEAESSGGPQNPGPSDQNGVHSWEEAYQQYVTKGLNIASMWVGSSSGDIKFDFSDDYENWENKKSVLTRGQVEGYAKVLTSESASAEEKEAAKNKLFGLAIEGRYVRFKTSKDTGGNHLGFEIYSKDADDKYHRNDEKLKALKYYDYGLKDWSSFDNENHQWEEYLKGNGYHDPETGMDQEVDGLILDLQALADDDGLFCTLPFDSRLNLSWWNEKYKGEIAASGDKVSEDSWVENGTVELVRVTSEDGKDEYYLDDPEWKPGAETDPSLIVEIGRPGYDSGSLRPGYDGPKGDYSAQQMLEAANKASGQCNVPFGSIATVKLIPDVGYQILAAEINGMPLTPDEGNQSQFSFKVTSNIHFRALFEETKDIVDVSDSQKVSAASVEGAEGVIDAGNLAVSVEDDKTYNTDNALKVASGTAVASLDVDVNQIVAKAGNLSKEEQEKAKEGTLEVTDKNFWSTQLAELSNDISISLTLDDITVEAGDTLSLVRDHEGKCEVIPVTVSKENGKTVATFKSDKFSTYTFVKKASEAPKKDENKKEEVKKEEPKAGDIVSDDKSGAKVEVIDATKKEVAYVAPKEAKEEIKVPGQVEINGVSYKVTKIDDKAFKNNSKVKKVTIPSSVTTIGSDAFAGCKKLTSVSVSKNLTKIGKSAFSGCSKLKTITIPSKCTEIGANAFKGCSSLTKVTLPSKTAKIGANAFNGCKKMKTITIKSKKLTKKTISGNAFKGLSKNVVIKVPKKQLKSYQKLLKQKGFKGKVKA